MSAAEWTALVVLYALVIACICALLGANSLGSGS